MIPVQAHLVLNHVPLIGLLFGLVFLAAGLRQSMDRSIRAAFRIFVATGLTSIPVALSGLMSASALAKESWLDAQAVSRHQLAGITTLSVMLALTAISGAALFKSRATGRASHRASVGAAALALVSLGSALWAGELGGHLRHTEMRVTQLESSRQPVEAPKPATHDFRRLREGLHR
jgi:hypothetical protein